MALIAVLIGFAAQALAPRPYAGVQGALLDALVDAPASTDTAAAADHLRELQAERLASGADPLTQTLPPPSEGLELEIRVALLRAGETPQLTAQGGWQLLSRTGELLQAGGSGQPVDGQQALQQQPEAWLVSLAGPLLVNGSPYAGRLRLIRQGSRLRLVNHLPLEVYISSVVGAEMPSSWSMEALRAQAIAARSYALAHMARPANRHWHLGDTTRWQAYRGLDSVADRTREAATSTAGLILSYQGAIVESLYAANREISLEAHGHLGASMSQHGAQAMAQQGYAYHQILGRYYPGASLARLRAGAG
jgi:stage II sporulation protein D